MPLLELEGHHAAVVGDAAREPDRRIAAERADLEHATRARHAGEQVQELARERGDLDGGKAGGDRV
jgi:hypothetical protein